MACRYNMVMGQSANTIYSCRGQIACFFLLSRHIILRRVQYQYIPVRILIATILFLFTFTANSQSTKGTYHDLLQSGAVVPPPTLKAFTLGVIPVASVDLLAPMRGANTFFTNTQWANIPITATATWSLDNYYRFYWSLMNTANGTYDFSDFDVQVQQSISRRQRFEFRVTTCDTDIPNAYPVPTAGGAKLVYPAFVHTQMQA